MRYVLAPLAGFTDAPFRRLCHEGGADLTYTEMVSAAGLAHGSAPTRRLMDLMPGEGPVAVQLFGSKEEELAFAVKTLPPGFVEVNLNAGCPMTKVTREGAGAKLVEDPDKIYRLLKAMVDNTSLPVTLKTRLGPRPGWTTVFEILDAAEKAGARGIAVHARYTSQMHGGELHLDTLAELVSRSRIPVVGNGSVVDRATADAMAGTGVASIMIGRAALRDPAIFSRLKGEPSPVAGASSVDVAELHLSYILEFRDLLARRYPDAHIPSPDGLASVKMHTHLFRYFGGRPGAAALRARLNTVRTVAEINRIIAACRQEESGA